MGAARYLCLALITLLLAGCAGHPVTFYSALAEDQLAFESELPIARVLDDDGRSLSIVCMNNQPVAPSNRGRNRAYEKPYYPWARYLVVVTLPLDYEGRLKFIDTAGFHVVTIDRPSREAIEASMRPGSAGAGSGARP